MARVVDDALEAGLDGVIVTPGPDLLWLTGYRNHAQSESTIDIGTRPARR
jgi:D-alanyl-D-alanine dipeptidase